VEPGHEKTPDSLDSLEVSEGVLGSPCQEIHILRRQRGQVPLLPEDYEGTEHLLPVDCTNLALAHAQTRTEPAVPTNQECDEGCYETTLPFVVNAS
jgi:hypothetical protein